jgi:hypothetical protein
MQALEDGMEPISAGQGKRKMAVRNSGTLSRVHFL